MGNDTTRRRTKMDDSELHQDDLADLEGLHALARRLREDPQAEDDLFQLVIRARLGPVIVLSTPTVRMLHGKPLSVADPQAEVPALDC